MNQRLRQFSGIFSFLMITLSLQLAHAAPEGSAQDLCLKQCLVSAECGIGGVCDQGTCRHQAHYCGNERWSVNERGESSNCDAYRCSTETGLCLREAKSPVDCLNGYVFDGVKSCIPSINCNPQDPDCQDLYHRWVKARAEYETTTPQPTPTPLTCQACTGHAECGAQKMCWQSRCVVNDLFCQTDATTLEQISYSSQGPQAFCGNFACDASRGQCFDRCLKAQDCRAGKNCVTGICL